MTSEPKHYPTIIALYSSAPQSGKTTFAKALVNRGYTQVRFADPLKNMMEVLLESAGVPPGIIYEALHGCMKEAPLGGAFGLKTSRQLMQSLGTEWGRGMVEANLWTNLTKLRIQALLGNPMDPPVHLVVDDMRFPNEYEAMKELGATLVRIDRPGVTSSHHNHSSEGGLDGFTFHHEIANDSDVTSLTAKTSIVLEGAVVPI